MINSIDYNRLYLFKNKLAEITAAFPDGSERYLYTDNYDINAIYGLKWKFDDYDKWNILYRYEYYRPTWSWFLNPRRDYEFKFVDGHIIKVLHGSDKNPTSQRVKTMQELLNYMENLSEPIPEICNLDDIIF